MATAIICRPEPKVWPRQSLVSTRQYSSSSRRVLILIWLLLILGIVELAASEKLPRTSEKPVPSNAPTGKARSAIGIDPTLTISNDSSAAGRMREGSTLVDQLGDFQKAGERYNFYPQDGKGVVRLLENLALDRVVRILTDDPSPRLWSVSGVLTEYRGENYLLITRAVLKSRTATPPAGPPISTRSTGTASPRVSPASP